MQPPFEQFVRIVARIADNCDLGRRTPSEACEDLRFLPQNVLGDQADAGAVTESSVTGLPELGDRAAAALADEPLLEAALRCALWSWSFSGPWRAIRGASDEQERRFRGLEPVLAQAAADAVERALAAGRGSASDYDLMVRPDLPEPVLRRLSQSFPPTPEAASSSPEMSLTCTVFWSLALQGRWEDAVTEVRALATAPQRAAGVEALVSAYYAGEDELEPLPAVVVDLMGTVDWTDAPGHLDVVTSYLLRAHRDEALHLLGRWAGDPEPETDDGAAHRREASLVAWAAGANELALEMARRDVTAEDEWDPERRNAAADFVLGQLETDIETRVDRLLRSARPDAAGLFQRRLVDAATLLLAHGEALEAACLLGIVDRWLPRDRRMHQGLRHLDPRLIHRVVVEDDECVRLREAVHATGLADALQGERLRFVEESEPHSSYRYPRSLNSLRRALDPNRGVGPRAV